MAHIKTALVVGGGIAGLAAALALEQLGIQVTVFEQATEFRDIGAGLWLWQNALHALNHLGLDDAVRAAGIPDAHGGVRAASGQILVKRMPADPGFSSVAILRADLHRTLAQGLSTTVIHKGAVCTGFVQSSDGVTLRLKDGRTFDADILIGADGVQSVIRAQLIGRASARYAGFTAWRAVIDFPHEGLPSGVFWGQGQRFGFMPVQRGQVNWFAGERRAPVSDAAPQADKRHLLRLFETWPQPIPDVIRRTAEGLIRKDNIYVRPPLRHWSYGRVTLLGDAAHPMTPSLGQGACQALEDAILLGRCVGHVADPIAALQLYERQRLKRTRAIARYSAFVDWVAMLRNPLLCGVRNQVVKWMPEPWRDRQLKWILEYEV